MFRWLPPKSPLIIAHRGASRAAPENTLLAFKLAAQSADAVELDARLARDMTPVVIHDFRLERTTNGRGTVAGHTSEELRGMHARDRRGRRGRPMSERIPLLEEVLDAIPARMGVNIEIKYRSLREDPRPAAAACARVALASGSAGRVLVSSFHHGAIEYLQGAHPSLARGFLVRPAALPAGPGVGRAVELGCAAVIYSGANITTRYADAARRAGLMVLEYTVNSRRRLERSLRIGVDGIITDLPAEMARLAGAIGAQGALTKR